MDYLKLKSFFNYYLSLEKDCFRTEPFTAFHEKNFKSFSIEYAKLLLSICCEIETVLKILCRQISPEAEFQNMPQYRKCINGYFKNFPLETVLLKNMNHSFSPWLAWKDSRVPTWWKDYTELKHKRADVDVQGNMNFYKANQENVLESLAALYAAEQYLILIWESKQSKRHGDMSYVLEALCSQELLMTKWSQCYESFMGNSWVNLGTLYEIVGINAAE